MTSRRPFMTIRRLFSLAVASVILFAAQSPAQSASGYKLPRKVHVGGDV